MQDIISFHALRTPKALFALGALVLLVASPRVAGAAVTASLSGSLTSPHYGCPVNMLFAGTINGAPGTKLAYAFNRFIDSAQHVVAGGSVTIPSSGSYAVNDSIPISTATSGTTFDQIWVHNISTGQSDVYSNEVHFSVFCAPKPTPTPKPRTLSAPTDLDHTIDVTTCADHGYARYQCERVTNDSLVLVWNWKPCGLCAHDVQGFKIYRTHGGHRNVVFFTLGRAKQTVAAVPDGNPNSGGYFNNSCYQVTAFQGNRESQFSNSLCAGAIGPQVIEVTPSSVTPYKQVAQHSGDPFALDEAGLMSCGPPDICVGFWDWDAVHTLGDSYYNSYYRSQLFFNGVAHVAQRITQATLTLTKRRLLVSGADRATYPAQCLGSVHGHEGVLPLTSLQVAGRHVSLDVTAAVAPLRSAPQFVFTLAGPHATSNSSQPAGENLNAFYNGSCLAYFSQAKLFIHYVR